MMPSLIWEKLAESTELQALGITSDRIVESQSADSRPFQDGYFITIRFAESRFSGPSVLARGPRITEIAVHKPWDDERDFDAITAILNIIDRMLLPLDGETGQDGCRVTSVRRLARSGNTTDEGWKTITRYGTFGVLYNEYDALTS